MELLNKKLSADKQAALDAILNKIPISDYVSLDLPSGGRFYDLKEIPQIRPLGWEDEKALVTRANDDNAISILLNSTLKGITAEQLIPMDRTYVLFKLREITVGSEYEIKITCPQCNKLGEVRIDTADFAINALPEDVQNPREIELPVSKLKMKVRFQKGTEEIYFRNPGVAIDNIYRLVEEIDGQTDTSIIAAVIKKLPSPDLQFMRRAMSMEEFGLDTKFMYQCGECKKESLLEAPIGSDFFLKT